MAALSPPAAAAAAPRLGSPLPGPPSCRRVLRTRWKGLLPPPAASAAAAAEPEPAARREERLPVEMRSEKAATAAAVLDGTSGVP